MKAYREAAEYIKSVSNVRPVIGIILGTGMGAAAEIIEAETVIDYKDIPRFPVSSVEGHAGKLILGRIAGTESVIMQGRVHFYEGRSMSELAVPVQTFKALGVEILIVTNASGGINPDFCPGGIVNITDHIKFDLDSPLRGPNDPELGERFFDMCSAYSERLGALAHQAAEESGIELKDGVYAYMGGPQFETPAEIRALRILGADLVGMSTVPEVICAAHCGMETLGLSCVTNMAAGMENGGHNKEIIGKAEKSAAQNLSGVLRGVIERL